MASGAITLPFRFDEFGSVGYSVDPKKVWQDRVYTAVLTQVGERVMRPGYGTLIHTAVFENASVATSICVKGVSTAFANYLKDLDLIQVKPLYIEESGGLEITIMYRLPSGEEDEVTVKTAVLSRSGDIIEEVYSE